MGLIKEQLKDTALAISTVFRREEIVTTEQFTRVLFCS